MPHILIVEDESAIADTLVYALQADGHSTEWVTLGSAAVEQQRLRPADLVILDIGTPFQLDSLAMRIVYRSQALALTRHEFRLLQCLLEQPRRVFSREQLLDGLGVASDVGYERTIDSHIKSLRAKLRQVAADAEPIQTHRGLGYSYSPEHA